jgi:hypothetical protein
VAVTRGAFAGKVMYGALFAVVIPGLLVIWARATSDVILLPAVRSLPVGAAAALIGCGLMLWGMHGLWVHGGGLPMNAFPPPSYVARGAFAVVAHPIYTGFVLSCAGLAVLSGSASGLWLVTPMAALGCVALVLGYERIDLRIRFGPRAERPWLALAPDTCDPPTAGMRLAAYGLVLIPWALGYEAVVWLGVPSDAPATTLSFERNLPVVEWTEVLYASAYIVVLLAPWTASSQRSLREFMESGLLAMALVFPLYVGVPLVSPPRPFTPHGALGHVAMLERAWDTPGAATPSFHVLWALLAARVYALRWPALAALAWTWALAVGASCVTTGMHSILDVFAGILAYFVVTRARALWERIRRVAERTANSWAEWRLGPVRIINHGAYAGLGSAVGFAIIATLTGPGHSSAVALVALVALVGSALWAQLIEGSPRLARPYGFFGGLLGIVIASPAAPRLGVPVWTMLAAACVAGPWIQSLGRIRCLVQGCCHGSRSPEIVGIRYVHPRSRVTRLSGLGNVAVHPTPLYSIAWNVLIALVATRLWTSHARLHLIAGVYLLLMGLGRFIEEAYRGEPQTVAWCGLRLYQWISVAIVGAGAVVTAAGRSAPAPSFVFHGDALVPALAFGLVTWFAMGVDFPTSRRRFSRLA